MRTIWRVEIIESERGWGRKVDDVHYFDTEPLAAMFIEEFNSRNKEARTPDWYLYADYPTRIDIPSDDQIIDSVVKVEELLPGVKVTRQRILPDDGIGVDITF